MRSVDTNVVVRYLMADDPEQFERAKRLFEVGNILILTTVLLETEWVLRSTYALPRSAVVDALRRIASHEGVQVQNATLILTALSMAEGGLELADALHLAASADCDDFVSFDRSLARRATALGAMSVVEPPAIRKPIG